MNADNPFKIKRLGNNIRDFDMQRWKEHSKEVVYRGLYAKFKQNPSLKASLISTGSIKLAEATRDRYWGIGMNLGDRNALDAEVLGEQWGDE